MSADEVKQQVMQRERSFAASMVRRDFDDVARHAWMAVFDRGCDCRD